MRHWVRVLPRRLGDRTCGERLQHAHRDLAPFGEILDVVCVTQLPGALPGDFDFDVLIPNGEGSVQTHLLPGCEALARAAEDVADPVERVTAPAAMPGRVLLDSTSDVIEGLRAELDDVECVQDGGGVFELVVYGVLVSLERVQRRDLHAIAE